MNDGMKAPDLAVKLGNLTLKNPVMLASGTSGYGEEYARFFDLNEIGGICVKGTSVNPSLGTPPGRVYETASGMLNAIGLQNVGVERFIKEKLPFLRQFDTRVIVNIYGNTYEDYECCHAGKATFELADIRLDAAGDQLHQLIRHLPADPLGLGA